MCSHLICLASWKVQGYIFRLMLSDLHAVGWMGNSTGLVYLFIVVVFLLLLLLSLSCTGPT